eukprot:GHUV01025618.1.p2 GENE.GHUV01025618.1~~GHUV01025618.1.p2  ORF type:complete len:130 (+),score=31.76 GHUV01025618.1:88-477(+)
MPQDTVVAARKSSELYSLAVQQQQDQVVPQLSNIAGAVGSTGTLRSEEASNTHGISSNSSANLPSAAARLPLQQQEQGHRLTNRPLSPAVDGLSCVLLWKTAPITRTLESLALMHGRGLPTLRLMSCLL